MLEQIKRKIPTILLSGSHAVKSYKFSDWQYVGDPIQIARLFSEKEADELVVIDPAVTQNANSINFELLRRITEAFHGPISYSGGVKNSKIAKQIIGLGYEKVCLNLATTGLPNALIEIQHTVGQQAVILIIDLYTESNSLSLYNHINGSKKQMERTELLKAVNQAPVGEVVLQFVERDGQSTGLETQITDYIAKNANKQVIGSCGAESRESVFSFLKKYSVSGAFVSGLYTFFPNTKSVLINYG